MICWTGSIPYVARILSEGLVCHMLLESLVNYVLLHLHWFQIKHSIQTKQTGHDQTVLNLDELI